MMGNMPGLDKKGLTEREKRLLNALVMAAPKLDVIFPQIGLPDEEKGACATYSRILAQVLGDFGIQAEVRPVLIITANRAGIDYRAGKISQEEALKRGGRLQYWGDIREGPEYQHAVCYIPEWDVVVDLAMTRRASGLVPSHPYWIEDRKFPWWLQRFEFMTYPLTYRAYETMPDRVRRAKELIRDIVRKFISTSYQTLTSLL